VFALSHLFVLPLRAADNSLSYLPEGLGGLTNLQSLRASNNTLLELPDSLVDLQALTALDLRCGRPASWSGCCSVDEVGVAALATCVWRCGAAAWPMCWQ
jgi:hypothetical protein